MEIIKASLMAAVGGGGGANLSNATFTANDTYYPTAPLDGWDQVTVNVPTYEDEYEALLECQEHVINALKKWWGNDFDPQDCDDIVDAIENIDKPVEEDKIPPGTPDDEGQDIINPEPPAGSDPTADDPIVVYELAQGEITRKVTWYWINEIHHNNTFYPLYSRDFAVDVTTYNGHESATVHREYNVGWVTGDDTPTMADLVDQNEWAVEYHNENTGTSYDTANGCRLHIHYIRRWGYPGYSEEAMDLYF